eukprot:4953169-Ditylum_brightwellii.AAC.1
MTAFNMQTVARLCLQQNKSVWKAKSQANKTWKNFKTPAAEEYSEFKEEGQLNARESGLSQDSIMQN